MGQVIVLVMRGKGSTDWVKPMLFSSNKDACEYIKSVNDIESKYWTHAEIVEDGEEVEIYCPVTR